MLRIAVQTKGRLYDETMALLTESGIKLDKGNRLLLVAARNFPAEILFLRDDDIPPSVANGVADIGIVGENEFMEKGQPAEVIKKLGFSKCRLSLAIPKSENYPFRGDLVTLFSPAGYGLIISFVRQGLQQKKQLP